MGNLLTYKQSFLWENTNLDRGQTIQKLNLGMLKSKEYKDRLYKTPDFNELVLSWGNLMKFIFSYGFDEAERIKTFPWMTQIQHTTLVYILSSFKNTTALNSKDFDELHSEFHNENCGYIGFDVEEKISNYVSCESIL